MDWNITCDDLEDPFEPTAEDWIEDEDPRFAYEEEEEELEEDFDEVLSQFQADFFGIVDTLNGYKQ